ncbi:hypothetical protein ACJVC5_04055 [Peredibacter sp. HCB2-198]|uniref:hypothetical protein n=1 Tax=Peredibacter sp. HCB2-198 TaxID=3383025 RepID=UPI0038B63B1F
MKKQLLAVFLLMFSLAAFAADETTFSALDCKIESSDRLADHEKAFKMYIRFKNKINAKNDKGLAGRLNSDLSIKFLDKSGEVRNLEVKDLGATQETSSFGYEIHSGARIQNSNYSSNLSIHPKFKRTFFKQRLEEYTGSLELNTVVDGNDDLIIKTGMATILTCKPVL